MYESRAEVMLEIAKHAHMNGTVAMTLGGETVLSAALGLCDREAETAYTKTTRTYIASVTKQFTAACVMMLVEEGRLNIDDTLDQYIPEYAHAGEVTLKQLMNMVSGIPHELMVIHENMTARRLEFAVSDEEFEALVNRACAPEACTPADFLALVNPLPLRFAPGSRYEYSDTNYMLLGEVVCRVSGQTLAAFMDTRIFRPLGMTHTVVGAAHSDAPSYSIFAGTRRNMGRAYFTTGEGSICTTADDLCLWLNAVLAGKLLSKDSWRVCFTPALDGYCCGWVQCDGGWYVHGGGDLGYSSMVGVNFARNAAIAYVLNESPTTDDVFSMLCAALLGESPAP